MTVSHENLTLALLGILGALAVLPYALTLMPIPENAPLPRPALVAISVLQSSILVVVAVWLGSAAAARVGLSVRGDVTPWAMALILGLGVSALIVVLDRFVFAPGLPEALRTANRDVAVWKRALAVAYGAITEEILMRLLLVSGAAWLVTRVIPQTGGGVALGIAVAVAAILFGIGHLPAAARLVPLSTLVVIRTIVLNAIGGVVFGGLYVRYGLVTAMIAHGAGDVGLHLVAPLFAGRS